MVGILLYLIAAVLFPIVALLNLIVVIYKSLRVNGFYRTINNKFFNLAKDIDIFANVSFPILWNTTLRKSGGYKFGNKLETLSSALGKNQLMNKLSYTGIVVVYILWIIDINYWFKGGHCKNSIDK